MSESSKKRAEEFLKVSDQFQLGALTTELSHPVTANLSETARHDIGAALGLLFEVDGDVLVKYREFVESGRAQGIKEALLLALKRGGRIFFTGCGATGRLSIQLVSIWREFWQQQHARGSVCSPSTTELENRALSVMAGGDFALIKSVEGFEDFASFGEKQIGDLGVSAADVVFAITEGGETSFVIGTAWKGVAAGAKVYFVYNNPDDVLCRHVQRSREVLEEPRIEKLNLTTGPMAITGSTRMQATTIQLCVLLTVLEMVLRDLMRKIDPKGPCALESSVVPSRFLEQLEQMHSVLQSSPILRQLSDVVALEEVAYRSGHKNTYFADKFGIDVLTDTTERSPTYCIPPFKKFDDAAAAEPWSFLFLPHRDTLEAWRSIIRREPLCVEWSESEIRTLVGGEKVARTYGIVRKIGRAELMRFKIGLDGLPYRQFYGGDSATGIFCEAEKLLLLSSEGFFRVQLEGARKAGAGTGLVFLGRKTSCTEISGFTDRWNHDCVGVFIPVPETDFLLDGVTRAGLKMLLNGISTCTMVRMGRVIDNCMVWVVASNLKLIDRATRYIQRLTSLDYRAANQLLFEVIEYVEPRMKGDLTYPPVVGLSVMRARHGLGNEEAERRLSAELG